ncbi:ornithine carbamoyltransferase [Abyssibacter profundi]|uniref:Ornithine carbamoyltransferase n=1 Tax=Abyssibacter profundi TaxID=2182787 RepID=A0A363UP34_9GAMM|nr:ornithine carbamoyltransferase [Abyssibacter profundi]PWN57202.1 ornithine carbamoyltransferase [Abyssibacter profundi]
MTKRDFLTLLDFTGPELDALIQRAIELKRDRHGHRPLVGRTLAMIFEKSSTRTRVSFEAGMAQLGGDALFLSPRDTQLGRGEPIEDTARVLGGMVDAVMIRNDDQQALERFAAACDVPVINALSDRFHPCQLLADVQTLVEHFGSVRGRRIAWVGDGNNVCNSFALAARQFGFTLSVACPEGFEPDADVLEQAGDCVQIVREPGAATAGADAVVTDVWASMGQESEQTSRVAAFAGYQVDEALMQQAAEHAVFLHCLPAHRGEEVAAGVIDGPRSLVWDEAENRLHAQKALLEFLMLPQ